MKHSFLQNLAVILVIITAGCIPLTSCTSIHPAGISSSASSSAVQDEESEGVKKTIDAYFGEVQSGELMNAGYQSALFQGKNPFDGLVFSESQSRTAMQACLNRINYTIKEITVDTAKKTAACTFGFTVPDVLRMKTELLQTEDGFYYDSFLESAKANDAPMKEYDCTLSLTLASDGISWIIKDTSSFAAILADPYIGLIFDRKYYKAEEVIDSLIKALAAGDVKTVDLLCSNVDSSAFFPGDELGLILAGAIYSRISYKESREPEGTDSEVEMSVTVTLPDMDANYIDAINDDNMITQSLKPAILTVLQGGTANEGAYAYRKAFCTELAARLVSSEALNISYDIKFTLVFEEEIDNWRISSVQTERLLTKTLEGYDPLFDLKEPRLQTAIESAADELFADGRIDQQQQSDVKNSFLKVLLPGKETASPTVTPAETSTVTSTETSAETSTVTSTGTPAATPAG